MEGGRLAAILDVSDDGPGIPRDIQELVFNAFFTTKPEGKGTGLGLASVRALMETVGGTVDVESLPGEGTTFRLAFPASV
jgi:signal transduction histidine kinase